MTSRKASLHHHENNTLMGQNAIACQQEFPIILNSVTRNHRDGNENELKVHTIIKNCRTFTHPLPIQRGRFVVFFLHKKRFGDI